MRVRQTTTTTCLWTTGTCTTTVPSRRPRQVRSGTTSCSPIASKPVRVSLSLHTRSCAAFGCGTNEKVLPTHQSAKPTSRQSCRSGQHRPRCLPRLRRTRPPTRPRSAERARAKRRSPTPKPRAPSTKPSRSRSLPKPPRTAPNSNRRSRRGRNGSRSCCGPRENSNCSGI